ncbi:MAG TPA: PQQ-binding-like beta-propeller repeat protein [Candidatus Paceibacterota bacterium]|nr:PQQ-binding-like beta-propeller repeat protein [Verrucomicrobiota bacterium]HRY50875.1 PQQ-binding-like beta-propeller repeat protein [Candidatus Paceibacterota bacterium]HSA01064.1 PQQ-binding-like beta-propeller repeat protein [Candidatus Paceibacterota bacterium]
MRTNEPMHHGKTLVSALCFTILLTCARADDWPQWQGPDRNAISKERGLLKEWPKDGPPLAWKTKGLGGGDGAPSIAGGLIFGMSNRGEDETVWALSEKDGQTVWTKRLGPAFEQRASQGKEGPACTPTVDGDRLYVEGLGGDVACLQVKDGKILWQRSLTRDFGGRVPMWSYRESPLIDGDKLICTPGSDDAMLVALDKMTGNTIWKSQMPTSSGGSSGSPSGGPVSPPPGGQSGGPDNLGGRGGGPGSRPGGPGGPGGFGRGPGGGSGSAYASPIAIDFDGQRQYVQLTARALIGVAASDGKFLWRYDAPANRMGINCSTPIHHDGMVFAASAYGAGGGLVKLSKDANGGVKAEEVYATKKMQNHHGGMILLEGCLYGANGGNEGGFLVCLDFKTGNVLWDGRDDAQRRAPKGSIALADGRFYYRTEKGTLLLIEPSAKEYIEHGRFDQPDRSSLPAWAHPVIANGKLYVRDQDVLICYDIKAK